MTQHILLPRAGFSDVDAEPDPQGYMQLLDILLAVPPTPASPYNG